MNYGETLLLVAGATAMSALVGGWLLLGAAALKRWICDEESIPHNQTSLAKWPRKIIHFAGDVEFGPESLTICIILFAVVFIVGAIGHHHLGRAVLISLGSVTVLILGGSHTLRWMMRTKKAISKVKNLSHNHKEV